MSRSRPTPELRYFAEVCADSIRHRHARLPLQCDRPGNSLFLSHSLSIFLAFSYRDRVHEIVDDRYCCRSSIRESAFFALRCRDASRPASGNNVFSLRAASASSFFVAFFVLRFLFLPLSFTLRGFPRLAQRTFSTRSPFLSYPIFLPTPFFSSCSFRLFLFSFRHPRRHREAVGPYLLLPTYLPTLALSLSLACARIPVPLCT